MTQQKPELAVRWLVLFLACFVLLGSYYSYDNPTATQDLLKEFFDVPLKVHENTSLAVNQTADAFNIKYSMLYSVYSYPNTVLPFFGGVFVDKLGVRTTLLIFVSLVTCGQLVFAIGISLHHYGGSVYDTKSWAIMWTGRVIFGLGGESLSVAQSAMIVQWFRGKELALALGMNLALARVGSVINDYISPLFGAHKVYLAMWTGLAVCVASLLCTICVTCVDRAVDKRLARDRAGQVEDEEELEAVRFKDVLYFPLALWLLTISCVTIYAAILPFNNIASAFFAHKFNWPFKKADAVMSITYLVSGFLSPVIGYGIDRVGKRAMITVLAGALVTTVHLLLGFTTYNPIPFMVLLGVAYSFYAAALWPSVAYVVEPKSVGTAYGVITAVQNAGLAAVPNVVALLQPPACGGTYRCVELLFASVSGFGVLVSIFLNINDARTGGALNAVHLNDGGEENEESEANPYTALADPNADDSDQQNAFAGRSA